MILQTFPAPPDLLPFVSGAAMNHLLTTPGVSWLDIIHQFGYYDQSHVI
ncbi:hypothetical protein [Spirosoma arcticum]